MRAAMVCWRDSSVGWLGFEVARHFCDCCGEGCVSKWCVEGGGELECCMCWESRSWEKVEGWVRAY